jgi:hypothetical protein
MSEDFMFIDEEVYNAQSGHLIHTIGQSPVCDGDTKQWLLNAGRYRVYGVSDSMMEASTELVTPHHSSTGTVQLTPVTRVKVEHAEELITILSDDSDAGLSRVRTSTAASGGRPDASDDPTDVRLGGRSPAARAVLQGRRRRRTAAPSAGGRPQLPSTGSRPPPPFIWGRPPAPSALYDSNFSFLYYVFVSLIAVT